MAIAQPKSSAPPFRYRGKVSRRPGLDVEQIAQGRRFELRLTGELEAATCGQIATGPVWDHLATASQLVLDLRELSFIDSSGARCLRRLCEAARASGATCEVLSPLHGQVFRFMQFTAYRL